MRWFDAYDGPWTRDEAAHLGRRAGFGRRPDELTRMVEWGLDRTVDGIVDYPVVDEELEAEIAALPEILAVDRNGQEKPVGSIKVPFYEWDLQNHWIFRMIRTRHPLQQQLQLFMHDHLVSDWQKVWATITDADVRGPTGFNRGALNPWTQKIVGRQYRLLRDASHGPYRALLRAVLRDPAMLIYLDNRINTKEKPQENFARELLELFTMGVGNYTEHDVREIARALTGEALNEREADHWPFEYEFQADRHDGEVKTVFGKEVRSDMPGGEADRIIDLILDHVSGAPISPAHARVPAAALHLAWKFLGWFVFESIPIDHPAVEELGAFFYETRVDGDNYQVREVLRKIFKSRFFHDESYRYRMVKHPMDYMVMAARNVELDEFACVTRWPLNKMGVPVWTAEMGMRLYGAPNVSGWEHGRAWINSGNLIARFNLAGGMSGADFMTPAYCDRLIAQGHVDSESDTEGIVEYFRARLLQAELRPAEKQSLDAMVAAIGASPSEADPSTVFQRRVRACFHVMMTFPRYQLK
ncbi:MAG: DUF1800 domain-containing protein [Planctomycetes bacterium]|nr:DUF1800 domain-containing protein [Planctomycetota bacterium]